MKRAEMNNRYLPYIFTQNSSSPRGRGRDREGALGQSPMSNNQNQEEKVPVLRIGQELPPNTFIAPHFRIIRRLASGSFGDIYMADSLERQDARDNRELRQVALKFELTSSKHAQLAKENVFYGLLGRRHGFPTVHWYGQWRACNVIAMDLLGRSLLDIFEARRRVFSLKTIIQLTLQLLDRFEYIHSKRIVYRDVKPDNFCFGLPGSAHANTVHVVDFGLSKEYADINGWHIEPAENKKLTGTARYMSINAHRGHEQSRRDDLESLAYLMLFFLHKGRLPWLGLKATTLAERYKRISQVKETVTPEQLGLNGIPQQFVDFLKYARGLAFKEKPNYGMLMASFLELYNGCGYENFTQFDWSPK